MKLTDTAVWLEPGTLLRSRRRVERRFRSPSVRALARGRRARGRDRRLGRRLRARQEPARAADPLALLFWRFALAALLLALLLPWRRRTPGLLADGLVLGLLLALGMGLQVVLTERLGARGWVGGILLLAGIAVSELKLRR
jgi:hypothetical protein